MRATKSVDLLGVERVVAATASAPRAAPWRSRAPARRRPCATGSPACAGSGNAPRSRCSGAAARRIPRPTPSARPSGNSAASCFLISASRRACSRLRLALRHVVDGELANRGAVPLSIMTWTIASRIRLQRRFFARASDALGSHQRATTPGSTRHGGIHTQPREVHPCRSDRDTAANRRQFLQFLAASPLLAAGRRFGLRRNADAEAKLPDPLMWGPLDLDRAHQVAEGSHQRLRLRAGDARRTCRRRISATWRRASTTR